MVLSPLFTDNILSANNIMQGFIQNFLVGVGKKHVHRATPSRGCGVMLPQEILEIYVL